MSENYDPELRKAAAEVTAILRRYDIGGFFSLHGREHGEFGMYVDTSWSLARFIKDGEAVHLKLHQSKQPQLNQTAGMIFGMRDMAAHFFETTQMICRKIKEHAKVEHTPPVINNDDRGPE